MLLTADENVGTLLAFRYIRRFAATGGGNGSGALKHGKNGDDVEIRVPVGTQVRYKAEPVADLTEPGQQVIVARGGAGGKGNARFAGPTNQFPLLAEAGEPGEERRLRLELKLLADVGIVGLPNAGKSSLLAAVSAARPKVASYPFTSLEPTLGMVEHRVETFVMVDIPGLIEGAHEGVGLGHEFLRHIERTRVLVHVVDGAGEDPAGAYRQINEELSLFNDELANKPQIVAINKTDIPEVDAGLGELSRRVREEGGGAVVYGISAVGRQGLDALLDAVLGLLDEVREAGPAAGRKSGGSDVAVLRPRPRRAETRVWKDEDGYVVDAPKVARVATMVDSSDWNARMQFYAHLRRTGVVKALEKAGAGPGDTVRIGDTEWDWE